jgi:hypothetical protein
MQPDQFAEIVARAIETSQAPLVARLHASESETKSLLARIAELEARPVPHDGRDGKDGERGAPGINGKDAEPVTPILERLAALEARPVPRDGRDGDVGPVGPQGEIGPSGEKGIDGINGKDGADGVGYDGKDGKDGVGLTGALIDRDGHLVVTLSDGTTKDVGVVVGRDADMDAITKHIDLTLASWPKPKDGRDGINGKDGADALGFDDLVSAVFDVERKAMVFTYARGDYAKELVVPMAGVVLDRGVYKAGQTYIAGDGVTWAGSFWIAQAETSAKPGEMGESSRAWRLAVKRGADGKVGQKGETGGQGPRGEKGERGDRW